MIERTELLIFLLILVAVVIIMLRYWRKNDK
jgi:cbb3-type cytochrome oxidase subunit 3